MKNVRDILWRPPVTQQLPRVRCTKQMTAEKIDFHNWGREKSFICRVWGIWVLEKNWRHKSSKMLSTSNSDLLLYFWRTCIKYFFTDDAAGGKITATMSRGLWKRAKESEAVIFGYILHISPPDEIFIEAYIEILSTSDRVEHLCYQKKMSYFINVSTGTPRCQISIVV